MTPVEVEMLAGAGLLGAVDRGEVVAVEVGGGRDGAEDPHGVGDRVGLVDPLETADEVLGVDVGSGVGSRLARGSAPVSRPAICGCSAARVGRARASVRSSERALRRAS